MVGGSDKHFEKVSGLLTRTMVLKADQKTKLMAGLIVILDKGMDIPVIPSFGYERKFSNDLVFDFILTAKTGLAITPTGRLSEKGKSFRRPIYKSQHDPVFYFNIGISVNPFSFFGQALKF